MERLSDDICGLDGIELLTGYDRTDDMFRDRCVSVHLPYATDWMAPWSGARVVPEDMDDRDVRYIFYGRDAEEVVGSLRTAIDVASESDPEYGVLHAGNANIDEILRYNYSDDDADVLKNFAEMVNRAVSSYPGGEPPFRVLFENLWWPGLRLIDDSGYRILEDRIEFDNWGLCLDTGHLLISTKVSEDERSSIERLTDIVTDYPEEMKDRIVTMHLHLNTSAEYMRSHVERSDFLNLNVLDRLSAGYDHVCRMDEHRPFSMEEVVRIAEIVDPAYITHEMVAQSIDLQIGCFEQQRSLFQQ